MGGKGKKKGGGSKANSPLRDVEESAYDNDDDDNAADMRGNQREEVERAEQRHGELMAKFEALITIMTAAASTTTAVNAAALSSAEGGTASHQALISSIDKQREATERLERRLAGDSTTISLADAVSKAVADRIAAVANAAPASNANSTSAHDVQTVAEAVGTAIATRIAALDAERDKTTKDRYDHLVQQIVSSVSNRSTATSSNASSNSSGSSGATHLAAARGLQFGSFHSPFTPRFSPLAAGAATASGGGTVASDSQGLATGANSTPLGDRPLQQPLPPPPLSAPNHGNSNITAALLKAMQTPVPRLKSLSKMHVMAFDKDLDEFNREFIRVDPSMIRSASSCMSQDDLDIVAAHLSGLAGPAAGATAYFCNLADADQRGALFSLYHATTPAAFTAWAKDFPVMLPPFDLQSFYSYNRAVNFALRFLGPEYTTVGARTIQHKYIDGLRPFTFSEFMRSMKTAGPARLEDVMKLGSQLISQFMGDAITMSEQPSSSAQTLDTLSLGANSCYRLTPASTVAGAF